VNPELTPLDRAKEICLDFYERKTIETALLEEDLRSGSFGVVLETPTVVAVVAQAEYSRSEGRRDSLRHLV
jgi:hypothetical protein